MNALARRATGPSRPVNHSDSVRNRTVMVREGGWKQFALEVLGWDVLLTFEPSCALMRAPAELEVL